MKKNTVCRWLRGACAFVALIAGLCGCGVLDTGFTDPWHAKLAQAGIQEKEALVGDVRFNYAEGPDNGPALLLLHAQHMDWYSYSRVLPELSKSFHVFAVSYNGHGKTESPVDRMNATDIGNDLAAFIETVIREPSYVTGNSSGGLLTLWLAANKPGLVKAILLEDPPIFTAEYPRSVKTVAYRTFSTCHSFLAAEHDDFLLYWIRTNTAFIERYAGKNGEAMLTSAIQRYRAANPGKALELNMLPDVLRLFIRGMDCYDPHFGDAFYDGRWNANFDHAEALKKVSCPALLLHANFTVMADGTLNGALDQRDAERAMTLLSRGTYERIDAMHTVHLDKPQEFIKIAKSFFLANEGSAR